MEEKQKKDGASEAAKGSAENSSEPVVSEATAAVRGSGESKLGSDEKLENTTIETKESTESKESASSGENKIQKTSKKGVNTNKRIRKPRKWLKRLIIIGAVVLAFYIFIQYLGYKAIKEIAKLDPGVEYANVEKMDLASTISTTGTIQSKDVRTLTSALSGVTINEVNYEVGDMVEEGAVVVAFSREDINRKIQNLQEDIGEAQAAAALTAEYKAREHEYDYGTAAYTNYVAGVKTEDAMISESQAQRDLDKAYSDKAKISSEYDYAIACRDSAQSRVDELEYYKNLWEHYEKNDYYPWDDVEWEKCKYYYGYYSGDKNRMQTDINNLKSQIVSYQQSANSYSAQMDSADVAITRAQDTLLATQRGVTAASASESETHRQTNNNVYTSDYNYARDTLTANDNINNLTRQMVEYENSLDDYIVYAPITGLVTQVNAQEGNGYVASSGALMTIQAIDVFEVTTQIDEYDINNVVEGQRVVIMTDATGDDELEGIVSFISPTATAANSGNTYEVDIDIVTKDERLKLGMSAKLNIIVDSHSGVLAVRYDALEEDQNGDHYVYVVDPKDIEAKTDVPEGEIVVSRFDGTETVTGTPGNPDRQGKSSGKDEQSFLQYLFGSKEDAAEMVEGTGLSTPSKKVYVNVGIEGDYYTEISSDEISEGTTVSVKSKSDNRDFMSMFMMQGGGGRSGGGPDM